MRGGIVLTMKKFVRSAAVLVVLGLWVGPASAVRRDGRWPTRGPWMFKMAKELPQLGREFNGIDFGHAHLGETLIETQDEARLEKARLEVLDFIFSSPAVQPDEAVIAPTFTQMVWELHRTFNWSHELHRSLYDVFASGDRVPDKENAVRTILAEYLTKPEAITPMMLDHMGKLWSFPESKSFMAKFPLFNTQIWAYHWLQGGVYDVQLLGKPERQRELMPGIIAHYHGYLRKPPTQWQFMPMLSESAPEFSRRYPEVAAIFDNLHMLHDNVDDVLSRPDLYPTIRAKRDRILAIHQIYLHANHVAGRYHQYHMPGMGGMQGMQHGGGMQGTGGGHSMAGMGPRPPSARMVLEGHTGDVMPPAPTQATGQAGHGQHQTGAPAATVPDGAKVHGQHAAKPKAKTSSGGKRASRSRKKRSATSGQEQPKSGSAAQQGGHH